MQVFLFCKHLANISYQLFTLLFSKKKGKARPKGICLRIDLRPYRKFNGILSYPCMFCNEEYIEEVEQIVDLLGSLQYFCSFVPLFGGLLHVLDAEECNITSFKNKKAEYIRRHLNLARFFIWAPQVGLYLLNTCNMRPKWTGLFTSLTLFTSLADRVSFT